MQDIYFAFQLSFGYYKSDYSQQHYTAYYRMLKLGDLGAHLTGIMFLLSVAGKTRIYPVPSSSCV